MADTEREAFEAWAKSEGAPKTDWWCRQLDDGGYSCYAVDMAWKAVQAATQRQQERIAELEAQVQALSLDAGMLDWLDNQNRRFRMGWRVGMAPAGNVSVSSVIELGSKAPPTTIREAISAAIAAGKEQA